MSIIQCNIFLYKTLNQLSIIILNLQDFLVIVPLHVYIVGRQYWLQPALLFDQNDLAASHQDAENVNQLFPFFLIVNILIFNYVSQTGKLAGIPSHVLSWIETYKLVLQILQQTHNQSINKLILNVKLAVLVVDLQKCQDPQQVCFMVHVNLFIIQICFQVGNDVFQKLVSFIDHRVLGDVCIQLQNAEGLETPY